MEYCGDQRSRADAAPGLRKFRPKLILPRRKMLEWLTKVRSLPQGCGRRIPIRSAESWPKSRRLSKANELTDQRLPPSWYLIFFTRFLHRLP